MVPSFCWPPLIKTNWIMPPVVDVIDKMFCEVVPGDWLDIAEGLHLSIHNAPGMVIINLAEGAMSSHNFGNISIIFLTVQKEVLTIKYLF